MTGNRDDETAASDTDIDTARRRFLERAGRFAIITPPAIYSLTLAAPKAHASGFDGVGYGVGGLPPDTPGKHPRK